MHSEFMLRNARIVTSSEIVDGSVQVRDGVIVDIGAGPLISAPSVDLEGDYLIPGLVDLHTDNLERHLRPRRDAEWPVLAALIAHDAEMVSVGITTIFDSLYVGGRNLGDEDNSNQLRKAISALETGRQNCMFRSDHMLHLRAETSREEMPELFSSIYPDPMVRIVSVMDHTPGQRQFANGYGTGGRFGGQNESRQRPVLEEDPKRATETPHERQARVSAPNRARLLSLLKGHPIALASHDDTTVEHVEQAHAEGINISEFPTTVTAAQMARAKEMTIVAGSPNLVIGRSLTGNVAVEELARLGLLDVLASDYAPASLLYSTFLLAEKLDIPLHESIKLVTSAPARATRLDDRGSIEIGKRADLVRVRKTQGIPNPIMIWREGQRVA
jgi:alpha-D-ribose 1-methylphosphonate 5-triphosphate diphosphatase